MRSAPDFFAWRMLEDWIMRYVSLRARAPEVIDGMRGRVADFEMVPVPKALIDMVSIETAGGETLPMGAADWGAVLKPKGGTSGLLTDPGLWDPVFFAERFAPPAGSFVNRVAEAEKARHAESIVALLKQLSAAVEAGDAEGLLGVIGDDYRDLTGRTKEQIGDEFQRFVKLSSGRRLVMTRAEQFEVVGNRLIAIVSGAWQADVSGTEGTRTHADNFRLELIFAEDREGRWRIVSARHA
jgi:ketosteroid isomerase-like protein